MPLPRTRRSPVSPERCNLASAISVIGDRWSLMILRSAMYGLRRFEDFHAELGIPRTVLSARLKSLAGDGLIAVRPYREPGKRSRKEYVLTDRGDALRPILIALTQWGDRWLSAGEPPISFTERNGGPVRAGFITAAGREVGPEDLRIVLRK